MAKKENILKNEVLNHGTETSVANWISQIRAGETVYDIATHHSIKFMDGKSDTTGVTWNGLSDLEIVIPNITDIVQTPIEFAGTVDANGAITWTDGHTAAEKGSLVFVTADCTFEGHACEAGDMAIYDGTNWNVVSGENQVTIVAAADKKDGVDTNTHTVAVGAAKDVLTVEGKTLALTLDYVDLNKHVSKTSGVVEDVNFTNMTVDSAYVKLTKGEDVKKTIGESKTIQKASQLANGDVTFTGISDLVTDVTFGEFKAGSLQQIVLNSDDRTFDVTGGSLTKSSEGKEGDFVSSVSLGKVTFDSSESGAAGAFALVNGISRADGQAFVTGVNGASQFTVEGCLQPTDGANATYVKGITGNYVTGLTAGSFTLNSGSEIAIGFGSEADSGDVLSSVTVSANNNTSVLNSATVSDHVLSFGATEVTSSVTVSSKYKTLEKTGFTYTPSSAVTAAFETSGFTKSSAVTYTLNTANESTYSTTSAYYKITTPDLVVNKAGYSLSNDGMVANVSANTFAVNVDGGVLPSLGASNVVKQANVTGSVATGLDYTDVTINVVAAAANEIAIPGAYKLEAGAAGDGVSVEVGKAGNLADNEATIDLSSYLKNVSIIESVVTA